MGGAVTCGYLHGIAPRVTTMLPRSTDLLNASVVISELPTLRRMPAPTPLPTLATPGLLGRVAQWWAERREAHPVPRSSAQVLLLRA